jgi:hypothetical protein
MFTTQFCVHFCPFTPPHLRFESLCVVCLTCQTHPHVNNSGHYWTSVCQDNLWHTTVCVRWCGHVSPSVLVCVCVCVSGPCGRWRFRHFPGSQTNVYPHTGVGQLPLSLCHFRCHSNLSGVGEKMTKSVVVKMIRPWGFFVEWEGLFRKSTLVCTVVLWELTFV